MLRLNVLQSIKLRWVMLLLLLVLATSPWCLSELRGSGVLTSGIEHSGPRPRSLLLLFSLALPPHLFLLLFLDRYLPPLSYILPIRSRYYLKPSKFSPATHLLSWCKTPPNWTSPAPAARQPLPLVPAPRAACLHLLPFPCRLRWVINIGLIYFIVRYTCWGSFATIVLRSTS